MLSRALKAVYGAFKSIKQQEKEMYGMANNLITNQATLGAFNVPTTGGTGSYTSTNVPINTIYTTNAAQNAYYGQVGTGYLQPVTGHNNVNVVYANQIGTIPAPSGSKITVTIMDASGKNVAMDVDLSYAQMLSEISYQHQQQYGNSYQVKMVDGDFSMDELELAETLIAEIEVGQSKKGTKEKVKMSAL